MIGNSCTAAFALVGPIIVLKRCWTRNESRVHLSWEMLNNNYKVLIAVQTCPLSRLGRCQLLLFQYPSLPLYISSQTPSRIPI